MKKVIFAIALATLFGQAGAAQAREVKVTGGIGTGYDYFDRRQKGSSEATEADTTATEEETAAAAEPADTEEDDYRRIIVRPLVSLQTVAEKDALEIRYQPGLYYDHLNDEHDIEQSATISGQRSVTKDWQLQLADSYQSKDDADQVEVAGEYPEAAESQKDAGATTGSAGDSGQLSDDRARRKYTTNSLQALSKYAYREDSAFSLGYTYGILRNEDDADLRYQDYDKHDALLSVDHRFNTTWKVLLAGHYIRGLFAEHDQENPEEAGGAAAASDTAPAVDTASKSGDADSPAEEDLSDDLTQYQTEVRLESAFIPHQPLSLGYSRAAYDYDAETKHDSEIHNLTLGWQWEYSPHLTLSAGAGPSYVVTEEEEDAWGYNGKLGTAYKLERGSFRLAVEKGLERQNFTGETADNGLVDFWNSRADFSYQLLDSTTVSLFAGYRYEDQDEEMQETADISQAADPETPSDTLQTETITTKRFSTGCSAKYAFLQWYAADLSYSYADQLSETPEDEYDEHRVILTLSFEKELFRW